MVVVHTDLEDDSTKKTPKAASQAELLVTNVSQLLISSLSHSFQQVPSTLPLICAQ